MNFNLSTTIKYLYEKDERSILSISKLLNLMNDLPQMNLYIVRTGMTTEEKYQASSKYIKNKTAKLKECFPNLNVEVHEITNMLQLKEVFDTILKDKLCVGYIIQEPFDVPDDLKEEYQMLRYEFEESGEIVDIENGLNKDIDRTTLISKTQRLKNPSIVDLYPITTRSCINLIHEFGLSRESIIVVIGRSEIVTKPLMEYLIYKGYTVIHINSRTPKDKKRALLESADCIVTAAGCHGVVNVWDYNLKSNVYIIDVGINIHPETGKLVGDLALEKILQTKSLHQMCNDFSIRKFEYNNTVAYTPVPGGVGKLTSIGFSRAVALNMQILYYKEIVKKDKKHND